SVDQICGHTDNSSRSKRLHNQCVRLSHGDCFIGMIDPFVDGPTTSLENMTHWLLIAVAAVLVFALVYRVASAPLAPTVAPPRRPVARKPEPKRAKAEPPAQPAPASHRTLPKLSFDEDDDVDPTLVGTRTKSLSPP